MDKSDHAASSSIDIEDLAASLSVKIATLRPLPKRFCVYRVPPRFRQLNEKVAYTPKVVSIGPLYHGRQELGAMEDYKVRYLQDFLERTEVSIKDFLIYIKDREAQLRNCYAEPIKLGSDDFLKMILVDAAFLIEISLRCSIPELNIGGDHIFGHPGFIVDIIRDTWSLENQLPMFILEGLFDLAKTAMLTDHFEGISMMKLIPQFLKIPCKFLLLEDIFLETYFCRAEHFVDLIRLCLQPSELPAKTKFETLTTPSITKLYQAGVKFKLGSSKHLFDIRFNNGILEIPKLMISDETEYLLRNVQVFEQLHSNTNYVNDYITIMNCLVNTPKDVELLAQKGVIENWLWDSEAVSTIFHNLVKESRIYPSRFYYSSLVEDLNGYCESPWHKWKANLKQNYFNTPWASISVIAAVILLILTSIQAVSSIFAL